MMYPPAFATDGGRVAGIDSSVKARVDDDAWPHTTRLMPWLLAAFMIMLWVFPFQGINLPISAPVDPKLDRLFLVLIGGAWLLTWATNPPATRRRPRTIVGAAIGLYVAAAISSVLVNLPTIVHLGQIAIAEKKLFLLGSYIFFFFMVTSSLRAVEVRPFILLMLGLATLTAVGVIIEYRFHYNFFYDLANKTFGRFAYVDGVPADLKFGRPSIVGPTSHGLAVTSMLAMAMPFAVIGAMRAKVRKEKIWYLVVTTLVLAGMLSTLRKTSFVMPAVTMLVLVAYKPRQMLKLLPAGLLVAACIQVVSPHAAVSVKAQFVSGFSSDSTKGRTSDYSGIEPDLFHRPLLGRGYGTWDSSQWDRYRLLDNWYLDELMQAGLLGLLAYLAMVLSPVALAHKLARSSDPLRGPPVLAASAACVGFAVATGLYDIISFFQPTYMFFLMAAFVVILVRDAREEGAVQRLAAVVKARGPMYRDRSDVLAGTR